MNNRSIVNEDCKAWDLKRRDKTRSIIIIMILILILILLPRKKMVCLCVVLHYLGTAVRGHLLTVYYGTYSLR